MATSSFTKTFKVDKASSERFFKYVSKEVIQKPKINKFKSKFVRLEDSPEILKYLIKKND